MFCPSKYISLNLKAPIATKVVCFSRLLKCLRSLYGKQCGPRSDCSYRSSLFWVHAVCFYTEFVSNIRQLFAADPFSRRHFQMHFFLGTLRVNTFMLNKSFPILMFNPFKLNGISHSYQLDQSISILGVVGF